MLVAGQGDPTPFEEWRGEIGCLLLHGFPGSPAEMRELGQYLAGRGISVIAPLLPGMGKQPEALRGVRWEDWLRAAAKDLRRLQEHCAYTFVAGLSMGGALALYLAAEVPTAGVVAICPAILLRNRFAALLPVAQHVLRWVDLGEDKDLGDPTAPQRQFYYTRVPAAAAAQVYHLTRAAWKVARHVRVPTLIVQSRHDGMLRPEGASALYERLGAVDKRLLWLERSGHNALIDAERETVFQEVYSFLAPVKSDTDN